LAELSVSIYFQAGTTIDPGQHPPPGLMLKNGPDKWGPFFLNWEVKRSCV
jgi:hypothetical protein